MKKAWNRLATIVKEGDYTTRELVLAGITVFLSGVVIGIFTSPRKYSLIGSNNGNNNNYNPDKMCSEGEEEE